MTLLWLASVALAAGAAGWIGQRPPVERQPPLLPLAVFGGAVGVSVALGIAAADSALDRSSARLLPAVAMATGAVVITAVAWRRGGGRAAGVFAPALLLVAVAVVVASRLRGEASGRLLLVAMVACLVVLLWVRVPMSRNAARVLAVAGVAMVALPLIPGVGVRANAATLWIDLPMVGRVQPGEVGRVVLVLGVAMLIGEYAPQLRMVGQQFASSRFAVGAVVASVGAAAIATVLMVLQRDLGPVLLIIVSLGITMWLIAGRVRYLLAAVTSLAVLGALLYPRLDYLQTRVIQWLDPFAGDEQTQVAAAELALAWGGWWGRGLGAGLTVGRGRIPAAESDYVLAFIGAEAGYLGLTLVLAVLALLIVRLWLVVATTGGGMTTAATVGLAALLSVQTVITTCGVAGLIPLTGVTTPLLSAGGSSLLATGLLLALVVAVAEPGRPDRPDRERPAHVRRGTFGAATATGTVVVIAAVGFADTAVVKADTLNRASGNYQELWAAAAPGGRILAADGSVLAASTHVGSADLARRSYPQGADFADPVGYRIPLAGSAGTERAWAGALRCGGTVPEAAKPDTGYPTLPAGVNPSRCEPADVVLGIDPGLQRRAVAALAGRIGAVVVLDANTGAVLAAASTPTVDPAPLAGPVVAEAHAAGAALQAAPAGPEQPGAWAVALPPGSVFKIVTAAAAMRAHAEGALPRRPDAAVRDCPGRTVVDALAYSCNQPFLELARRLGVPRMTQEAAAFGIGGPSTVSGLVGADTAVFDHATAVDPGRIEQSGIGQGDVRATLLDVTSIAATVATAGVRTEPQLVTTLCADGAEVWNAPTLQHPVIAPDIAAQLATGMRAVVTRGTAHDSLGVTPGAWAAKTGTAQLGEDGTQAAWIVGFPTELEGPPVAVGVLVRPQADNPKPTGGTDAAAVLAALAASGPLRPSGSGPADGPCAATR